MSFEELENLQTLGAETMSMNHPDYRDWLGSLKTRFRQVQLNAAVAVNSALLQFYWELGADIVARQQAHACGQGFLVWLSADLMREFPEVKGFSASNMKYIRQWYLFWRGPAIGQQPVGQLTQQAVSQMLSTEIRQKLGGVGYEF